MTLFRLSRDGMRAYRTPVRLGIGSLERVSVLAGLAQGDAVIVSDTSSFNNAPELRII